MLCLSFFILHTLMMKKERGDIMENISLGQIASIITLLSIFVGAITGLIAFVKSFVSKILKPLDQKIETLQNVSSKNRNSIELEMIKMFLVNFINDIEQGTYKSQIQTKNAYELYDRYQQLGGNSYIHDSFEKLIKEGKI